MPVEHAVAAHYTHGGLQAAIDAALAAAGVDAQKPSLADLAPIDEFHIGGHRATQDLVAQLDLPSEAHVLDVGSGLGGAARTIAAERGCRVTGIDLTPEYVAVAETLTRRVGLEDRVDFRTGSALALPFDADSFDAATMLHVGMNIADKTALFREIFRTLRRGATLAVYDVMREGDGALAFPLPWAGTAETSFLESAATYRAALAAAGFEVIAGRSRRAFAQEFFRAMQARPAAAGLGIVLGPTVAEKVGNMIALLDAGTISPTEILARAG